MRYRVSIVFFLLSFCGSAFAVIQLKLTVGMMYSRSSPVLIAKVSALNEANRVIEAEVTETLLGQGPEKFRLQIVQPQNLFARIRVGDPIVLMAAKGRGAGDASIHLADTWLLARLKPESNPPIWQINQAQSNDFTKAYPGTTESLSKLLREFKEGKSTFMDKADERLFTEGASEIVQLKITPTALFVADLDGDGTPELVIGTPHGPRVFAKSGDSYSDITKNWSLPDSGLLRAVGDLNDDKKPDLLIDKTIYVNEGTSFTKTALAIDLSDPSDTVAINMLGSDVLLAISKSGKLDGSTGSIRIPEMIEPKQIPVAGVISKDGVFVAGESSLSRLDWMNNIEMDFTRLTGESLSTYLKDSGGKFKNPKLVSLDANGDGRRDLLVLSDGANFLLINRGFGAYFVSPAAAHLALGSAPDKPFPYAASATSSHWAAIDTRGDHREDLLILTPDGALYRLGNAPPH